MVNQTEQEKFFGYLMNAEGQWDKQHPLNTMDEVKNFVFDNVETTHEIRVCDAGDEIVLHVVDKTLVYNGVNHVSHKWDPNVRLFVNEKTG